MKLKVLILAGLASAGLGGTALLAQQLMMPGHGMPTPNAQSPKEGIPGMQRMQGGLMGQRGGATHATMGPKGDNSPASLALHGVNTKMHGAMDITYTGNADRDFVAGMIAHHQGAIDMAKVVLAFGKDVEVKKLAEEIVKAQEKEVAWMTEWAAKQQPK